MRVGDRHPKLEVPGTDRSAPDPSMPKAKRPSRPRASRKKGLRRRTPAIGDDDWRDPVLARLRDVIQRADPEMIEEVKWRKPSNPDGVPVWSHDGIVCVGNILKNAVRLTFPDGARIPDPQGLFNTRLDSRTVRAIDVHRGEPVRVTPLRAIVRHAVRLNVADSA